MKIAVVGGGPSGLYFAYLMKKRDQGIEVEVFEQNPADATYGFGVVFSDLVFPYLQEADRPSFEAIMGAVEAWENHTIVHRDERVLIDGVNFAGIARLDLLQILQGFAAETGVAIHYNERIDDLERFADYDLIVAADGVNSAVRALVGAPFGTDMYELTNRFAWYGSKALFPTVTLTFRPAAHGTFVAHHYPYSQTMSTFLVECDEAAWIGNGLDAMSDAERLAYAETIFAAELGGHPLISNNTTWRRFPVITNRHWSAGKAVLMGDALRSAHFSIGSGTRLAMEDAIALWQAFGAAGDDVPGALAAYERARRPIMEKLTGAAKASFEWYEEMGSKMHLSPLALTYDYMLRSGRIDDARLRRIAPLFAARYHQAAAQ
jgi:2-polyprenyl-6-methoxyphenol hydroxylase-like FAD-dependent oxidoreductase